jgi:hypothetical protein
MGAALKILLGLVAIAAGLGFFIDSTEVGKNLIPDFYIGSFNLGGIDWFGNFLIILTGFIPPFLILIGLFIVWLEVDELKTQRELEEETEKEKREKLKKKVKK